MEEEDVKPTTSQLDVKFQQYQAEQEVQREREEQLKQAEIRRQQQIKEEEERKRLQHIESQKQLEQYDLLLCLCSFGPFLTLRQATSPRESC